MSDRSFRLHLAAKILAAVILAGLDPMDADVINLLKRVLISTTTPMGL